MGPVQNARPAGQRQDAHDVIGLRGFCPTNTIRIMWIMELIQYVTRTNDEVRAGKNVPRRPMPSQRAFSCRPRERALSEGVPVLPSDPCRLRVRPEPASSDAPPDHRQGELRSVELVTRDGGSAHQAAVRNDGRVVVVFFGCLPRRARPESSRGCRRIRRGGRGTHPIALARRPLRSPIGAHGGCTGDGPSIESAWSIASVRREVEVQTGLRPVSKPERRIVFRVSTPVTWIEESPSHRLRRQHRCATRRAT